MKCYDLNIRQKTLKTSRIRTEDDIAASRRKPNISRRVKQEKIIRLLCACWCVCENAVVIAIFLIFELFLLASSCLLRQLLTATGGSPPTHFTPLQQGSDSINHNFMNEWKHNSNLLCSIRPATQRSYRTREKMSNPNHPASAAAAAVL